MAGIVVVGPTAEKVAHSRAPGRCATLIVARRRSLAHRYGLGGRVMKRRDFFGRSGAGAVMFSLFPGARRSEAQHEGKSGPLATATMSFGAWRTDMTPPTDRHSNPQSGPAINWHPVVPHQVTIAAGGTVNFVVAGLHQIAVYDDGIQPSDINAALSAPDAPNVIDDPNGRIYRGLNPNPLRTPISVGTPPAIQHVVWRDRVEVVHFAHPGTYLVICTVRSHFVDHQMWAWVKVLP
jgi:plastocyanin